MLIRVIQPKRVAQLVNKDTANIANRKTIRAEPERPAIRIKRLVIVKEHVRFNHVASRGTPVGDSQGPRSEGLPEDCAREDNRVHSISRRRSRTSTGVGIEL